MRVIGAARAPRRRGALSRSSRDLETPAIVAPVLAFRSCNYYDVVMTMMETSTRKARTMTAIRFPEELHERLRVAAKERDLSINWIVVKAVEDFLERLIPADELRLTRS